MLRLIITLQMIWTLKNKSIEDMDKVMIKIQMVQEDQVDLVDKEAILSRDKVTHK